LHAIARNGGLGIRWYGANKSPHPALPGGGLSSARRQTVTASTTLTPPSTSHSGSATGATAVLKAPAFTDMAESVKQTMMADRAVYQKLLDMFKGMAAASGSYTT